MKVGKPCVAFQSTSVDQRALRPVSAAAACALGVATWGSTSFADRNTERAQAILVSGFVCLK